MSQRVLLQRACGTSIAGPRWPMLAQARSLLHPRHGFAQQRWLGTARREFHSSRPKLSGTRDSQKPTDPELRALLRQHALLILKRRVIVWGFWIVNGLVFLSWVGAKVELVKKLEELKSQSRTPLQPSAARIDPEAISPKMQRMMDNWTSSRRNLDQGRYHTLLTAALSHKDVFHLIFNMVTFNAFMSVALYSSIPGRTLAGLVVGSAVVGNLTGLADQQRKGQFEHFGLGSSTINMGLATAMACTQPFVTFHIFGVIPVKLWQLAFLFTGVDMFSLDSQTSTTGHAAHLGGAAFGLLFYFARLRRYGDIIPLIRYLMARFRK